MEKLQVAIEQARMRREARTHPAKKTAEQPKSKAAAPTPQRKRGGPRLLPDGLIERWDQLQKIRVPSSAGDNRRLVSNNPGPDAAHYDVLRTKLLIELRKNGWRRVAVTSPTSGCGKTTTVSNLALSISRQGDLRTVLLDLDLRRPGIARVFGHTPEHDISELLGGNKSFGDVVVSINGNLAIAMAGHAQSDPTKLLASDQVAHLLDEIEEVYAPDVVLFDLPPLLAGDDARSFLRHADCAMLMAQAEVTTAQQVDISEREVAEQTNVVGVVLNQCKFDDRNAVRGTYSY